MKKYKFKVENETYDWEEQYISGEDVRGVGPGIPDSMDLFLKRRGEAGIPVANGDKFDLAEPGIEKFYAQDASSEAG